MREPGKHDAPQEGLGGARHVHVLGVTGSGKTTAAARTSEATGIPWTGVDPSQPRVPRFTGHHDLERRVAKPEPVTLSQTAEQVG
ncbi:MAG TPA: hypothetical protein VFR87_12220 [Nocardioidaceae bacterium]|nr:hypothetical protein [Nocardioidaceae bacterium]